MGELAHAMPGDAGSDHPRDSTDMADPGGPSSDMADPADLARLAAAAGVVDGATIAVGGQGMARRPMALLRAIVASGVRDLEVVSFLGGIDVEYLLAAGVVRRLHTAGTSLGAAGMAPLYRRARQDGDPRVSEWGEGGLHAALDAAARGVPYLPTRTAPGSDIVGMHPDLRVAPDPFGGLDVVVARALEVDVALLHVPAASDRGDLFVEGDPGVDDVLVRAARRVVVTTDARVDRPAAQATIPRLWVDVVVDVPGGSWPTPCHPTSDGDPDLGARWAGATTHSPDLVWGPLDAPPHDGPPDDGPTVDGSAEVGHG